MIASLIISILTIIFLIIVIIVKPTLKIKKIEIQTFWLIPLVGALFLFIFRSVKFNEVKDVFLSNNEVNPLKILALFISISFLSIVLDEAGFFKKCALLATKITKGSQKKLFLSFGLMISILTVFTSNDIVILTFTPFICYFAKHNNISPLPYLIGEFVFANTLSMMLIIGNPTNIYLASSYNIDFLSYLKIMVLPSLVAAFSAYFLLNIIFRKKLNEPLTKMIDTEEVHMNKFVAVISSVLLGLCTIFLAISSYLNMAMWIIACSFAGILLIIMIIYDLVKKQKTVTKTLKRLSWNLIPFVCSMFIIVTSLDMTGIIKNIAGVIDKVAINKPLAVLSYGVSSFFSCNILNNIPMSVMYERIIAESNNIFFQEKIYSTIVASNIGAYLSPIGALAGIMWMSIINKAGIKFNFRKFLKYGLMVSPLILMLSLVILMIVL